MKKLISVITPTLNERENVRPCHDAVKRVFVERLPQYDFEHIFTDNNSADGTRDVLRQLADEDKRVKVILNSRNFGAEASMLNALHRTNGDAVVVMIPADLQDPPDLIADFVKHWEEGYEVVYGVRKARKENPFVLFLRKVFYRAVNGMSPFYIPPDVGEFQLIDRIVVQSLMRFKDRRPYLRGMIASCGFKSYGIDYDFLKRARGRSKMNLARLSDQGLNGLISFSSLPMRACMWTGFAISALSLMYAAINLCISLIYFREITAPGISTIFVGMFWFGGVQLFFMGVLGEYILAIHRQVRQHPMVIESETKNFEGDATLP